MKGTPDAPQCGFSRAVCQILDVNVSVTSLVFPRGRSAGPGFILPLAIEEIPRQTLTPGRGKDPDQGVQLSGR